MDDSVVNEEGGDVGGGGVGVGGAMTTGPPSETETEFLFEHVAETKLAPTVSDGIPQPTPSSSLIPTPVDALGDPLDHLFPR